MTVLARDLRMTARQRKTSNFVIEVSDGPLELVVAVFTILGEFWANVLFVMVLVTR